MPTMSDRHERTADQEFEGIARVALDDALERHPEEATYLGDHRYDDRLSEAGPAAREDERRAVSAFLDRLVTLDSDGLSPTNAIDADLLAESFRQRLFELDRLRQHEWDPLVGNPADAIYPLLAREFAPAEDRLRSVAGRLSAVPRFLEAVRADLGSMPRVHVETAIGQFEGTVELVTTEVDRVLDAAPAVRNEIDTVRPAALEALEAHVRWLRDRVEESDRDPRIGPELFAPKLAHALDAATDADAILARAEADLERVEQEIAQVAARLSGEDPSTPGLVRRGLDRQADDRLDDTTVVDAAKQALEEARAFVEVEGMVSLIDDPVEIIVMPEFQRGVAIAYCDPPGPLETGPLPTFFAISPTPEDWPPERVESFYREYNAHMIHDLSIHEAVPGHMLQLAHWRRFRAPTNVRAALWSGSFVEGWAVYSERLMTEHGYRGDALRMQQLKMQLRMIINSILDARVHAHGMTEEEGMRLMLERGHQEEGEAVGKWRRAVLTSAQLSTYYVGYTEVGDLVADLRSARPELSERQLHDLVLSEGSPAPRHLRRLLLPA
jgi:uncharacterized protein (DUF885 family)